MVQSGLHFMPLSAVSLYVCMNVYVCVSVCVQVDGTAWMAFYAINMMKIALELSKADNTYEDLAVMYLHHFLSISAALNGIVKHPGNTSITSCLSLQLLMAL